MGIFSRIGRLVKANINDLVSKSEDPEKILNQLIVDMKEQLIDAKKQVAVAIADEKKLKKKYDSEVEKAKEWEKKAMTAVQSGRDDLAKKALKRKQEHDDLASEYKQQWQAQKEAADKLRGSLRDLNEKIEEAKRKKSLLIARKKRAEAQQTIQDTMSGLNDTSAFEAFDRMEGKIDQLEAEAEASAELAEASYQGDELSAEFEELETEESSDQALEALKAKMGVEEQQEEEFTFEEEDLAEVEQEIEEEVEVQQQSSKQQDESGR